MKIDIVVIPGDPGAAEIYLNHQFPRSMDEGVVRADIKTCAWACTNASSCNRYYGNIDNRFDLGPACFAATSHTVDSDIYELKLADILATFREHHQKPNKIYVFHHLEEGDEVLISNLDDKDYIRGIVCSTPEISGYTSSMVSINGKRVLVGRKDILFLKHKLKGD